ncbi:DUF2515 domain-containing protein [Mesobacillus boroniphilus]|uniref:DUF2515 domain-containing protein n=1 Tax=Mesobacillus boroniphilus TaxID=308892 RepID=A0A944CH71_9BACI|nr:DUF2515 domain-containing protein [Mesobacillus boroniphilus]MBS8263141.1 DUF2515 domain-containing protein [Mesobacillus boroniphilus]
MSSIEVLKESLLRKQKVTLAKNPSETERKIIQEIKFKTEELNKNNITRTKAYLDFYKKHPEIQWAFLAHMVSRNGGWNMTDLKAELLTRLLSKKEKSSFFSFLERGNWLIFHDAYPQLLIYEESVKRKKPLFRLLPHFNVSIFIETIWEYYWKSSNSSLLTIGLIINEQNYIENRVIQNQNYIKDVFSTLEFELQDFLSFNQILFPYNDYGVTKLAGQTVNQFESLDERIQLGKRLYAILFDKEILNKVEEWAMAHPHSGSRKDYWPHIFNDVHEGIPGLKYQIKLSSCKLKPGARKIYSPTLQNVWKNVKHPEAEGGEWFSDFNVLEYLDGLDDPSIGNIEFDYCQTLERLELAAFAKKIISILD